MQNGSDSLPSKSAFKNVIFRRSTELPIEKPPGTIVNKLDQEGNYVKKHSLSCCQYMKLILCNFFLLPFSDSVIVQFKICCPNIAEGTSVIIFFPNKTHF